MKVTGGKVQPAGWVGTWGSVASWKTGFWGKASENGPCPPELWITAVRPGQRGGRDEA